MKIASINAPAMIIAFLVRMLFFQWSVEFSHTDLAIAYELLGEVATAVDLQRNAASVRMTLFLECTWQPHPVLSSCASSGIGLTSAGYALRVQFGTEVCTPA